MLQGFTAGLLLITVSELGEKTFLITALLAMRHSRRLVFAGSIAALFAMTLISVAVGQAASLLPLSIVQWAEVLLFLGFGLKLLWQAAQMSDTPNLAEQQEAADAVKAAESKLKSQMAWSVILEAFSLTFVAEWGDRTQFTTIALATANSPVGVILGSTLGHAVCAALAVQCGRLVCGRISERKLTALGGLLFLLFGLVGLMELNVGATA